MHFISYIIYRGGLFLLASSGEVSINSSNWSLLKMIGQFFFLTAAFILIILFAVYTLKFAARFRNYSGGNSNLRVVESKSLGGQNFAHIVKAGDKYVLLGSSKENVTFLAELNSEGVTDVFGNSGEPKFEQHLSSQIKKLFNRDAPPEE